MTGESAKPHAHHLVVRLDWIDALKGIGILAVVAAHVWTRGFVRDALYSFHMPLFFLLSGYTARAMPTAQLAARLARSLGVPFLCFSALLLAAEMTIEPARGGRPMFASAWAGMRTILFATEKLHGPFTILWFVPCLIVARLAWNGLIGGGRHAEDRVVLIAMAGVLALALLIDRTGGPSPFGLIAVPGALLMLWAGSLWRGRGEPGGAAAPVLAAAAVAAVIWLPPINMKFGALGLPLLSLAGAAVVTLELGLLARHLPAWLAGALAWLGRRTMVIMYAHVAFIHYLAPYWPRLALFAAALSGSLLIDALARSNGLLGRLLLGRPAPSNPA